MNSLPNQSTRSHTQKSFRPIQKPCQSFQTVFIDDSDVNLIWFTKNNLNEGVKRKKRKASNMLECVLKERNMNTILISVFKNIFVPNFVAFLLICLIMKFEHQMQLDCYNGENYYIYFVIRNALFFIYFYYWGVGLCFFFEEKKQKLVNLFVFLLVFAIIFGISCSPIFISDFIFYYIPLLFEIIVYSIIKFWQREFKKIVLTRIFFVILMFILVIFDRSIIRHYLIEQIYISLKHFYNQKIVFQCFLFFFYQIHGKIFLSIITKFRTSIPKNVFLFLIKYYIMNVLSSCTTLYIVYSKERFIGLFETFNFITQLLSLYMQENILLHFCYSLIEFFKKKRHNVFNDKKDPNSDIKSMIAGLTNETMYGITFTLMTIIFFQKTFQFTFYDYGPKQWKNFCVTNFDGLITFVPHNLCILFAINFFYFFYLLFKMKDDNKIKFLWKRENYSFLVKIYLIILFQGNADINFQFFMYLNLLDNKIKEPN